MAAELIGKWHEVRRGRGRMVPFHSFLTQSEHYTALRGVVTHYSTFHKAIVALATPEQKTGTCHIFFNSSSL